MRGLGLLLRLWLFSLGPNRARHSRDVREKRRYTLLFIGAILICIVLVVQLLFSNIGLGFMLNQMGAIDLLPPLMMLGASMLVLFTTMYKAGPTLFSFADYDLQMSLPVSPGTVVASRVLILYLTDLAFSLLFMLPCGAVYVYFASPGVLFYVYFLLGLLLLPLLPILAASVIGAGIAAVSARSRAKNALTIIFSLLVMVAIMVLPMLIREDTDLTALTSDMALQAQRLYPPAALFGRAVTAGDTWAFLLLTALSLGALALFVLTLGRVFPRLQAALSSRGGRGGFRFGGAQEQRALRMRGAISALLNRERRRFFAVPVYTLNTGIGAVMLLLLAVGSFFMDIDSLTASLALPGVDGLLSAAAPAVMCFVIGIGPTTACSISLEGRHLWILQSLPVRAQDIFASKMALQLAVYLPAVLIAGPILALRLDMGFWGICRIVIIPSLFVVYIGLAGLCINLALPSLSWTNETAPVKQGASTLVTMLAGFLMAGLLFVLTVIPGISSMGILLDILLLGLPALACVGMWTLLQHWGARRLASLH